MRQARPNVPAHWSPWLASWDLAMASDQRSARTRQMYLDAVRWLLGTLPATVTDWRKVTREQLRGFFAGLSESGYSRSYVNNIGRCVQQWDRWYAIEEDVPRLLDGMKLKVPPPVKLGSKPVPIIEEEQLVALITDAEKGRTFEDRRDAALLRLFMSAGCRLEEVTLLRLDEIDVAARTAIVTGKGDRTRTVRFNARAALALDRYLRLRSRHRAAALPALWLGVRRRTGMTPDGVYQVIRRRGKRLGFKVHPHQFRHTFAHRWLDAGGAEGDLMEQMGWTSPQMVRHYGASARGARARRAYDRLKFLEDI